MSLSHRYFEHKEARIEVVPMIDIMMFLLIFFMLIMLKMIEASGIPLTLPNSNSAEKIEQQPVKRTLSILKDGTFMLERDALPGAKITEELKRLKATSKDVQVVVAADKSVEYQKFVEAMDIVRNAGIDAIGTAAIAGTGSSAQTGGAAQ